MVKTPAAMGMSKA